MEIKNISDVTLKRIIKMMGNTNLIPLIKEIEEQSKNEEELCSKLDKLGQNLVWYVCYGSNLHFNRYMCYLTGEAYEKYKIKGNNDRKCLDSSKPIVSEKFMIPWELYFAYSSSTWNGSSVAFIDSNKPGKTIGRAYLVTKEQFEHVMKWECGNGRKMPEWDDLYGFEVDLGMFEGYPAKTFTHYKRYHDTYPVSDLYQSCIIEGLVELGYSKEDATQYVKKMLKNRGDNL